MTSFPLIPHADSLANEPPGLQPLWRESGPGRAWRPGELNPFPDPAKGRDPATSFPDPFYRREATRLAIAEAAGGYWRLWCVGLRALASGLLSVEVIDLSRQRGELGKALARLHPERRFLAHFFANVGGQRVLMALGDPELLLWPTARRSAEQWAELERQVDATEHLPLAVLNEWRELMRQAEAWDDKAIPWMRGLSQLLGPTGPGGEARSYHEDARAVGPLPLLVRQDGKPAQVPVYVPVYERGWAAEVRLLASMALVPVEGGLDGRQGSQPARLRLIIPGGSTDEAAIYQGLGLVRRLRTDRPESPQRVSLGDADGLFDLAGRALYPDQALEISAIQRHPWRYPDPVRVLVRALGAAGVPARSLRGPAPASLGQRAVMGALLRGGALPTPESILQDGGGFVLRIPGAVPQLYVDDPDRFGVAELRELGWVLWELFLGEARPGPEGTVTLGATVQLRVRRDGRPEAVDVPPLDEALRAETRDRLATLQRFARAWSLGKAAPHQGERPSELLRAAAHAWVRWCTGADPFPNGPLSQRVESLTLNGESIRLPCDIAARTA